MGFRFKIAPGVRVRVSKRGSGVSVGPRIARVHVGKGGVGFSSGAGPVTYSTGTGRRKRIQTYGQTSSGEYYLVSDEPAVHVKPAAVAPTKWPLEMRETTFKKYVDSVDSTKWTLLERSPLAAKFQEAEPPRVLSSIVLVGLSALFLSPVVAGAREAVVSSPDSYVFTLVFAIAILFPFALPLWFAARRLYRAVLKKRLIRTTSIDEYGKVKTL